MNETQCIPALPRLNDVLSGHTMDSSVVPHKCMSVRSKASCGQSYENAALCIMCNTFRSFVEDGPCHTNSTSFERVGIPGNEVLSGGIHENRGISCAAQAVSQGIASGVSYMPLTLHASIRPLRTSCKAGAVISGRVPRCNISIPGASVDGWGVVFIDGESPSLRVKSLKQGRKDMNAYYAGIGI